VRKLLSRIDVVELEAALTRWIHDLLPDSVPMTDLVPLALDGKSLRGTWDRFDLAVHLLNVIDQRTKSVLHQRLVPGDTNEHKVALEVLQDLVLTGRVVTADAAFCHQDVCQTIVDCGGNYVLPVKDNQPQLAAAISSEFTAQNAVLSS
jgi:Transposase DDE domain